MHDVEFTRYMDALCEDTKGIIRELLSVLGKEQLQQTINELVREVLDENNC